MRFLVLMTVVAMSISNAARADDAMAKCEKFFAKFQTCVDGLKGEQQEEAKVFMKTLRGTLGMADGLNRGDPMLTGMMCGFTMDEVKKDPSVQKYNCAW